MKKVICLCVAFVMVLCCFAGCQKPLTEEEKALKELQDAWNAMVVEKTETIEYIGWNPGSFSSIRYATKDANKIAGLFHYFEDMEPEKFQLAESEREFSWRSGWLTLWKSSDFSVITEHTPLMIRVSQDNRFCIKMKRGTESEAVAYYSEMTMSAEEFEELIDEQIREQDLEIGGGIICLW